MIMDIVTVEYTVYEIQVVSTGFCVLRKLLPAIEHRYHSFKSKFLF